MTNSASRGLTSREIDDAQHRVAPEHKPWSELVAEMSRYGAIVELGIGGIELTQDGEATARTFRITPGRLREALVIDTALQTREAASQVTVENLPEWFLDDLRETIGESEEPYSEPYVLLLGRGDLAPSTSPTEVQRAARAMTPDEQSSDGVWSTVDESAEP